MSGWTRVFYGQMRLWRAKIWRFGLARPSEKIFGQNNARIEREKKDNEETWTNCAGKSSLGLLARCPFFPFPLLLLLRFPSLNTLPHLLLDVSSSAIVYRVGRRLYPSSTFSLSQNTSSLLISRKIEMELDMICSSYDFHVRAPAFSIRFREL